MIRNNVCLLCCVGGCVFYADRYLRRGASWYKIESRKVLNATALKWKRGLTGLGKSLRVYLIWNGLHWYFIMTHHYLVKYSDGDARSIRKGQQWFKNHDSWILSGGIYYERDCYKLIQLISSVNICGGQSNHAIELDTLDFTNLKHVTWNGLTVKLFGKSNNGGNHPKSFWTVFKQWTKSSTILQLLQGIEQVSIGKEEKKYSLEKSWDS